MPAIQSSGIPQNFVFFQADIWGSAVRGPQKVRNLSTEIPGRLNHPRFANRVLSVSTTSGFTLRSLLPRKLRTGHRCFTAMPVPINPRKCTAPGPLSGQVTVKLQISDGTRSVEIETGSGSTEDVGEIEALAIRMYNLVQFKGGSGPIGFTSATTADNERAWQTQNFTEIP